MPMAATEAGPRWLAIAITTVPVSTSANSCSSTGPASDHTPRGRAKRRRTWKRIQRQRWLVEMEERLKGLTRPVRSHHSAAPMTALSPRGCTGRGTPREL